MRLAPFAITAFGCLSASPAVAQCPLTYSIHGVGAVDGARAAITSRNGLGRPLVEFFSKSPQGWQPDGSYVIGDFWMGYDLPVAIRGDRVLAGSPESNFQKGRAFVLDRVGTNWVGTELVSATVDWADFFGSVVALDGDVAVVAAAHDPIGGGDGNALVHVFERQGTSWAEVAVLPHYTRALAIEGTTIAIGTHNTGIGQVQIYERVGGAWIRTERLQGSDSGVANLFGIAVALQGDTLVVGAASQGSFTSYVRVFRRGANGWELAQHIPPPEAIPYGRFGQSVALSGTTLLVGAPGSFPGRVYRYEHDGTEYVERSHFGPEPGVTEFGRAVALYREDAAISGYIVGGLYRLGFAEADTFCPTVPNSTGLAGTLGAEGCDSLSGSRLTLVARNLPPNALGLVFFGPVTTQVPLGDGFRCIGAGLHRLPVEVADGAGVFAHDVDFSTWPGSLVTAGRTWNFQALHRDPGSAGTGLNLTQALAVRITP